MTAPNQIGGLYGGGVYPNDNSRGMATIGCNDRSGNYTPAVTVVSGNNAAKYFSSVGINTYKPQTESYVLNLNGPMRIDNGDITLITSCTPKTLLVFDSYYDISGSLASFICNDQTNVNLYEPANSKYPPYTNYYSVYSISNGTNWSPYRLFDSIPTVLNTYITNIFILNSSVIFLGFNSNFFYLSLNYGVQWIQKQITNSGSQNIFANSNYIFFSSGSQLYYIPLTPQNNIYNTDLLPDKLFTLGLTDNIQSIYGSGSYTYIASVSSIRVLQTNQTYNPLVSSSLTPSQLNIYPNNGMGFSYTYKTVRASQNTVVAAGLNIISWTTNSTVDASWNSIQTGGLQFNSVCIYNPYNLPTPKCVILVGNNATIWLTTDLVNWGPIASGWLNTSGKASVLLNTANNFVGVGITDPNTFIFTTSVGQVYNCFLPNIFNRVNNGVLDICGNMAISGDIHVNDQGGIISNNEKFRFINEGVNRLYMAGDATRIIMGNSLSGNTQIRHNLNVDMCASVNNNLYVSQIYSQSNNTVNVCSSVGGGGYITIGNPLEDSTNQNKPAGTTIDIGGRQDFINIYGDTTIYGHQTTVGSASTATAYAVYNDKSNDNSRYGSSGSSRAGFYVVDNGYIGANAPPNFIGNIGMSYMNVSYDNNSLIFAASGFNNNLVNPKYNPNPVKLMVGNIKTPNTGGTNERQNSIMVVQPGAKFNGQNDCNYQMTSSYFDLNQILKRNADTGASDTNIQDSSGNVIGSVQQIDTNLTILGVTMINKGSFKGSAIPNAQLDINGNIMTTRIGIGTSTVRPDAHSLDVSGNIYYGGGLNQYDSPLNSGKYAYNSLDNLNVGQGGLRVSGVAIFQNQTDASITDNAQSAVQIIGGLEVNGQIDCSSNLHIRQHMNVDSYSNLVGNVSIGQVAQDTVYGAKYTLDVYGITNISQKLFVGNDASFNANVFIHSKINSTSLGSGALIVDGGVGIGKTLFVDTINSSGVAKGNIGTTSLSYNTAVINNLQPDTGNTGTVGSSTYYYQNGYINNIRGNTTNLGTIGSSGVAYLNGYFNNVLTDGVNNGGSIGSGASNFYGLGTINTLQPSLANTGNLGTLAVSYNSGVINNLIPAYGNSGNVGSSTYYYQNGYINNIRTSSTNTGSIGSSGVAYLNGYFNNVTTDGSTNTGNVGIASKAYMTGYFNNVLTDGVNNGGSIGSGGSNYYGLGVINKLQPYLGNTGSIGASTVYYQNGYINNIQGNTTNLGIIGSSGVAYLKGYFNNISTDGTANRGTIGSSTTDYFTNGYITNLYPNAINTGSIGSTSYSYNKGYFNNISTDGTANRGTIGSSTTDYFTNGYINNLYPNAINTGSIGSTTYSYNKGVVNNLQPDTNNSGNVGLSGTAYNKGYFNNISTDGTTNRGTIGSSTSDYFTNGYINNLYPNAKNTGSIGSTSYSYTSGSINTLQPDTNNTGSIGSTNVYNKGYFNNISTDGTANRGSIGSSTSDYFTNGYITNLYPNAQNTGCIGSTSYSYTSGSINTLQPDTNNTGSIGSTNVYNKGYFNNISTDGTANRGSIGSSTLDYFTNGYINNLYPNAQNTGSIGSTNYSYTSGSINTLQPDTKNRGSIGTTSLSYNKGVVNNLQPDTTNSGNVGLSGTAYNNAYINNITGTGTFTTSGSITTTSSGTITSAGIITASSGITSAGLITASSGVTVGNSSNILAEGSICNIGSSGTPFATGYFTNIYGTLQTGPQNNITTLTGVTSIGKNISTTITGTLQTAAQTNITSVGTLSSLTLGGALTLGGVIYDTAATPTAGTDGYVLTSKGSSSGPIWKEIPIPSTVTNATNAANVTIAAVSADKSYYLTFVDATSGNKPLYVVSSITTNASTGQIGATSFNASSDYRIKENLRPITATVDDLNPLQFYNKQSRNEDMGFIAHEVQEQFPFLVTGEKDGEQMQSLNYSGLIALLTKEIQDLKKENRTLKYRLDHIDSILGLRQP
jgi:hypothetical protein